MPKTKFYTVIGLLEAKPSKEKELEAILTALVEASVQEEGCVNYNLYKCNDSSKKFMFYENWLSKEALEKHAQSAHVKAWHAKRNELLATPNEVTFWEIIK